MENSKRMYGDALALLDSLQSNRSIAGMINTSDRDMNLDAIPEMLDWVCKAGYKVEDFDKLRVIHVAGSKGKGSVCAMVSSILQQYGTATETQITSTRIEKTEVERQNLGKQSRSPGKIGLYTSPHLNSVRERIRINDKPISQSLFAAHFFTLWDRFSIAAASSGHQNPESSETKPGYFRYLTIMALHTFLREGVRTAIVECGIGGEYDSTNIFSEKAVTVAAVTRLGIDHVGMLGGTIEKIAWHKAGIFKKGAECFTVPQVEDAMQVLNKRVEEKGVVLHVIGRNTEIDSGNVILGLEGEFQKDNASLAVAMSEAHLKKLGLQNFMQENTLPAEFKRGLQEVRWEGRCEVRREGNIEWCIDGAHNMDSLNVAATWFATKLKEIGVHGQAMLIFNQQDRDGAALVQGLHMSLERATGKRHIFSSALFCANSPYKTLNQGESRWSDGANDLQTQRTMADAWSEFEADTDIKIYSSIEEAVQYVREVSKDSKKLLVLVTGSLHLVGGLLKVLQSDTAAS